MVTIQPTVSRVRPDAAGGQLVDGSRGSYSEGSTKEVSAATHDKGPLGPKQMQEPQYVKRRLQAGEPAPWFRAKCGSQAAFNFDSMGGAWIVLMFFGTLGYPVCQLAHQSIVASRSIFDDKRAMFFGVSIDPLDKTQRGVVNSPPGLRYFEDQDRSVSRRYGAALTDGNYQPYVLLLDPALRVVESRPIGETPALLETLSSILRALEPTGGHLEAIDAPVLIVPRIFEPELCRELIAHYDRKGGSASGFMRPVAGQTVRFHDPSFKRRKDVDIEDEAVIASIQARLRNRLIPMIERAYGWKPTFVERQLIACYDEGDQGFFNAHRDTTTPGTAHRQLAVTINLNAEAYDGGELRFREYSTRLYKPPTGGAAVFGGGLLHEVTPVTRGRRLAYLPFLYGAKAAALREQNMHTIVDHPA